MLKPGDLLLCERRGELVPSIVLRAGPKRFRARTAQGLSTRGLSEKYPYKFTVSLSDPQILDDPNLASQALGEWLEAQQHKVDELPAFDPDELWAELDPEERYSVRKLTTRQYGEVNDISVLAFVKWSYSKPANFVLSFQKIRRQEEFIRQRMREKIAEEERIASENQQFIDFVSQRATLDLSEAPDFIIERFELLKKLALSGKEETDKQTRKLADHFNCKSPDEVLHWLCDLGVLPRDVNEQPARKNLSQEISEAAQVEYQKLIAADLASMDWGDRRNLDQGFHFSMDHPETSDIDDAIGYWQEGDKHWIAVHIADVDALIPRGSELDKLAFERASTIYFRDETWPMLPGDLVEHVLSLTQGEPRPAVSVIFSIDDNFEIVDEPEIFATLVTVDARLDYQASIQDYADHPAITVLSGFVQKHLQQRLDSGAAVTRQYDMRFNFDGDHVSTDLCVHNTVGHKIVSELMVFYGSVFARFLRFHEAAAFFKIQPEKLTKAARSVDIDDPIGRFKRRFPPSKFSLSAEAHQTMGLECYLQATSPIRRYTDLIAQRQVKSLLKDGTPEYSLEELAELRKPIEKTLSNVRKAEDLRVRYWVHRALACNPGPHTAYVTRKWRNRFSAFLPDFRIEIPIFSQDKNIAKKLSPGDKIQVIGTDFKPRDRWTRIELFEDGDDSASGS